MYRKKLTRNEVKLYMDMRLKTETQEAAAARAEISISSAYRIEKGIITGDKSIRHWKTRHDPFADVWDSIIKPQLEKHSALLSITILEHLQEQFPGKYPDKLLRTLQRRVKKWRIKNGKKKDVIFAQDHVPGRFGLSDFTILKKVTITVAGQEFPHILYHFRLAYSGWSFMKVIQGGESYTALASGLQEALWRLGGVPQEHRTDSLAAAYKNVHADSAEDTTKRYEEFCAHYNMLPSRNNKGIAHENGSIESPHGHVKRRIEQALLVRESCDFKNAKEYQIFIDSVISNHNRRNAKEVDFERKYLQKLPQHKTTDFTEMVVRVHSTSTVKIKHVTYSVPANLCQETLRAHLYHDKIELYFGAEKVFEMPRIYGQKNAKTKVINYKHIIHALHKKPQAFRYSQLRDSLFPNEEFKKIWKHVNATMKPRAACKFIVGLLYIADKYNCESQVSKYVIDLIAEQKSLSLVNIEQQYRTNISEEIPDIEVSQHLLQDYDNHVAAVDVCSDK